MYKETTNKIYRVIVKSTGSIQPIGTYWKKECVYCGKDLQEAKIVYYTEEVSDFGGSFGNPARETIIQVIEPGQDEEDIEADEIRSLEI